MAALVLGVAGAAIGGSIGGAVLGVSAATLGGFIGSAVGSVVDSMLLASLQPDQRIQGARLESLAVTSSTEGAVIPRLYGRMRLGGNIIWATDFREKVKKRSQGGGKGGGGGKVTTTEYSYFASFAVALCEGRITGIGRIWADGKLMDVSDVEWRWYRGSETQDPDPLIKATMGAASTPAYRGTAYVVFEDLPLARYGNRLPQLSFEVFRPLADGDTAEGLTRAVTMIPASGEFVYATEPIRSEAGTATTENAHALSEVADMTGSLDRLEAMAPAVESVSLVVAWFGNDLRAGACTIRPGVEVTAKTTKPRTWSVNGVGRDGAHLVSRDEDDRPVYGGTPADFAVVQAIQEMKQRGLRVTFYPFILMDVPPGNTLPNPYSANAAATGQPVFPWRGRITCSPAAGYAGTVDRTATAAAQVASFFGSAAPSDFSIDGEEVEWTGSADWGFRRMVLHYAHLCAAAGGVDAFLIGSELRGLTTVRSSASAYPAVQQLVDLAEDVRSILGGGTKISYAADWSEYFGHHPQDGSDDVFFHLDALWAGDDIDFIGIDNYMPLSDWRDGFEHADAESWPAIYDRGYLQANVEGGEGFDWHYASSGARESQTRTPITDGAAGKPWVFRYKDIRSWWSSQHRNRPGGTESGSPTAWVPQSKPIRFTEFGCPAIDRGPNQPNVFVDPKSSESFVPYFSRGWRDDAIQRAYLEAFQLYWNDPAHNPASGVYAGRMIETAESAAWTWDARPYPFFPALGDVWADGASWRLGHWLTGRLGAVSLAALVRHLCVRAGLDPGLIDVSGLWGAVEGYAITAPESPRASISMLARHFGFDACESEGVIRFAMRESAAVATVAPAGMVASQGSGEVMEIVRAQETELPQALKWQLARADEDYAPAVVEARRITVHASRIAAETFAVAVPPEEAERRCRRALMEAWVGRETAAFRLPPSRLALDPGDRIRLDHDGRYIEMRIAATADGEARTIEAVFDDRAVHDTPPGAERPSRPGAAPVVGTMTAILLNLPRLREDMPEHAPLLAASARPWPGEVAVYRSPALDDFRLLEVSDRRAATGTLAEDFYSGPAGRFDHGNTLEVNLAGAELAGVTDASLFLGANALAVESAPGAWEVLQAGLVELVAPERYRLTRLLRGQRGTEGAVGTPYVAAGARIVLLDDGLLPLTIEQAELGLALNWRVGPASRPITSDTYAAQTFAAGAVGLRPFAPTHVRQPWRWSRSPGDLEIAWFRRTRSLLGDSWDAAEVPLEEASEAYEVDILDGAALLRTLASTAPAVTYAGAQQIADWGALLGPGDTLDVAIHQLSAAYGRGAPCRVTLHF